MIKNFIKKYFGETNIYRFIAWLKWEFEKSMLNEHESNTFKYFGEGAIVSTGVMINNPERIIIKEHSSIAMGTTINSRGGLYIGRYSGIGINCVIWTGEHHYRKAKSIPFDDGADLKPVIIRDFVWIGSNVKIFPGKEIGEGAIVGLGAVITKDVPPLAIVFGNPAEIVGYRDKEHFEKCKKEGCFCSPLVGSYKEELFPYHKRKFKKELIELGLLNE